MNADMFDRTDAEPAGGSWRTASRCFSVADLKAHAKRRLPNVIYDFLDGGADDERTLRANEGAFQRLQLMPHQLVAGGAIDTSVTVLGTRIASPIIVGPTGMTRLFHPEGELAVARAASRAGTIYCLSTMGSESIEAVAAAAPGPKCFQIYAFRDRGLTREFIHRAREAGYNSLCLTVDVPVPGNRERDLRNGMTLPPKLGLLGLADIAMHPRWALGYALGKPLTIANVAHRVSEATSSVSTLSAYIANQFDPTIGWDDVAWMIDEWQGPFAIKGILSPADAERALAVGATAVIVSNHGGRQLDGVPASIEALPAVVDAVGDRLEVLIDGGIRRGTDILKALALGARACLIGRPYLYALAAAGQAGVSRLLDLLEAEVRRDMALLGVRTPAEVSREHLAPAKTTAPIPSISRRRSNYA